MKKLVFEVRFLLSGIDAVRLETHHGSASTKDEALASLKSMFQRRMIRGSDGIYRMTKTVGVRVVDGQGLIE